MATKKKTDRPSDYLPEVAADICSLLAGGESLRKVCECLKEILEWRFKLFF